MHPDGVTEIVHTVVPDMLHQLLLTHRTSLMYHQVFQNAGFLTCKREALSLYAGSSCTCIEGQIFAGKKYILLGELPQGQAADADPHQQQEKDRHQDTRHFFDTGRGAAHDDAPRQQQDEPLPEQGHRPIIQQRGKTGLGHGRIRGRDGTRGGFEDIGKDPACHVGIEAQDQQAADDG